MTASTRCIRYIGRNHDTPAYHPVQESETIAPMDDAEFSGPYKLATWAVIVVLSVLFWIAFIQWVRS